MMLRMEARYTSSAVPTNNPYGFIVFLRFSMSDNWKIIAVVRKQNVPMYLASDSSFLGTSNSHNEALRTDVSKAR